MNFIDWADKVPFPQRPSKIQMKKTDPGQEGGLTPK